MSLSMLHRLADEPFQGCVSCDEVAARIEANVLGDTPPDMRESFAQLLLGGAADAPSPVGSAVKLGGIDGLLIAPSCDDANDVAVDRAPGLVWFHGGGYVFGSPETHWRVGAAIATMAARAVFLPRYRLAPEHPWPAQLDDALTVVRALQHDGQRVALAGDSAGGHLALTTALALAREGRPVAALLLCSRNTDRSGLNTTRGANDPRDPMNDDAQDTALARLAFGDTPAELLSGNPTKASIGRIRSFTNFMLDPVFRPTAAQTPLSPVQVLNQTSHGSMESISDAALG